MGNRKAVRVAVLHGGTSEWSRWLQDLGCEILSIPATATKVGDVLGWGRELIERGQVDLIVVDGRGGMMRDEIVPLARQRGVRHIVQEGRTALALGVVPSEDGALCSISFSDLLRPQSDALADASTAIRAAFPQLST